MSWIGRLWVYNPIVPVKTTIVMDYPFAENRAFGIELLAPDQNVIESPLPVTGKLIKIFDLL